MKTTTAAPTPINAPRDYALDPSDIVELAERNANERPLAKVPRIVVYLHRRADRTICASYDPPRANGVTANSWLLRARTMRSADLVKIAINGRLRDVCDEVVYVGPEESCGR